MKISEITGNTSCLVRFGRPTAVGLGAMRINQDGDWSVIVLCLYQLPITLITLPVKSSLLLKLQARMRCFYFFLGKPSLWLGFVHSIFKINCQDLFWGNAYNKVGWRKRWFSRAFVWDEGEGTTIHIYLFIFWSRRYFRVSLQTSTQPAEISRLFSLHLNFVNCWLKQREQKHGLMLFIWLASLVL